MAAVATTCGGRGLGISDDCVQRATGWATTNSGAHQAEGSQRSWEFEPGRLELRKCRGGAVENETPAGYRNRAPSRGGESRPWQPRPGARCHPALGVGFPRAPNPAAWGPGLDGPATRPRLGAERRPGPRGRRAGEPKRRRRVLLALANARAFRRAPELGGIITVISRVLWTFRFLMPLIASPSSIWHGNSSGVVHGSC
jgi:hypothetical protein